MVVKVKEVKVEVEEVEVKEVVIPVVDLKKERRVVAEEIVKASEEYGFFKVVNHDVSHRTISNMEQAAFSFFSQPFSLKNSFSSYASNTIGFRGDLGHLEYLLLHSNSTTTTSSLHQYPSFFRCSVSEYTGAMRELACEILELMAEGMGVPNTRAFSSFLRDPDSDSLLRLNHYPPLLPHTPLTNTNITNTTNHHHYYDYHTHTDNTSSATSSSSSSSSPSYKLIGFGEHSDPQIITILKSNDVHGLQISLPNGTWLPVSPDPSAFCVNVGDVLQVMTNGRSVSVRHRAMTNSYKSRMSMAYFGGPPLNACIVAPPEMITPERPSLYRPFTWAEYKQAAYSLRLGDNRLHHFRRSTHLHHSS